MTRPRVCTGCGVKPVATKRHQFCFTCEPGGPFPEPPCRRCGSADNYYSAELCARCHQYAPQQPESCEDCHAWGVARQQKGVCYGCRNWRKSHPTPGICAICGRRRRIDSRRLCRLCWRQAANSRRPQQPLDPVAANRYGQQLCFADMHRRARSLTPAARASSGSPPASRSPAATGQQLSLVDQPDPRLEILETIARDRAVRLGWSKTTLKRVLTGIRTLCRLHPASEEIRATDVAVLAARGLPVRQCHDLLAEAGLLNDDRTPAIEAWFVRQVADLPAPMIHELRVWFGVLLNGSSQTPRSRPRSPITIKTRLMWALPTLRAWADQGHRSLREISRQDVQAALPASGNPRATRGFALRSIFGILKAHKTTFTNPTLRIDIGTIERRQPLPFDPDQIREAFTSPNPGRTALAGLIAFHGPRSQEIRNLKLTDIRDGRLHLPDRTIPLAELVKTRLAVWLDHRNDRWPHTANPHLFLHHRTATGTGPVGSRWVGLTLGMSPDALRQDRILDEAVATGGDVRRLSDLFGITVKTALHYTTTLSHPELEADNAEPGTSSPTQGST